MMNTKYFSWHKSDTEKKWFYQAPPVADAEDGVGLAYITIVEKQRERRWMILRPQNVERIFITSYYTRDWEDDIWIPLRKSTDLPTHERDTPLLASLMSNELPCLSLVHASLEDAMEFIMKYHEYE